LVLFFKKERLPFLQPTTRLGVHPKLAAYEAGMRVTRSHDTRNVSIGQRLRAARLRLGISQQEAANRIGVSYQQINKYERGSNVLSGVALLDLADLLKVKVGWLLGEEGLADTGPPVTSSRIENRMLNAMSKVKDPSRLLLAVRFVETMTDSAAAEENPGEQADSNARQVNEGRTGPGRSHLT
jgi:transcriptional regulator with XRE-family HTH domain